MAGSVAGEALNLRHVLRNVVLFAAGGNGFGVVGLGPVPLVASCYRECFVLQFSRGYPGQIQ